MMVWLALAVLAAATLAVLAYPLLRRRHPAIAEVEYDLAVYRDQLAEIERDVERGLLNQAEAAAARTEISRRMLAVAGTAEGASAPDAGPSAGRGDIPGGAIVALLAVLVGGGAFGLYLYQGSPGRPAQPFAERPRDGDGQRAGAPAAHEAGGTAGELEASVERLAARMRETPGDLQGWILLGRSYLAVQRYERSATAYRHAVMLAPDRPDLHSALGEALTLQSGGTVTPDARKEFQTALAGDAGDPRARFFIGLAHAQAGEMREAVAVWRALERDSPDGAPWMPAVRDRIEQAAASAGFEAASVAPAGPPAPITVPDAAAGAEPGPVRAPESRMAPVAGAAVPGPTADDVAAAQEMSADDRLAFIRTMVGRLAERLEENPDDVEGWKRLGRSYQVLGEAAKAREAWGTAAALVPDDVEALDSYAASLLAASGESSGPPPPEFMRVMRTLLALDPGHRRALWFVSMAEAEAGNGIVAAALLRRLIAQLDPTSEDYKAAKARLDSLAATKAN